jgi:hypothetical protein
MIVGNAILGVIFFGKVILWMRKLGRFLGWAILLRKIPIIKGLGAAVKNRFVLCFIFFELLEIK